VGVGVGVGVGFWIGVGVGVRLGGVWGKSFFNIFHASQSDTLVHVPVS
jgi:hypothetical protein